MNTLFPGLVLIAVVLVIFMVIWELWSKAGYSWPWRLLAMLFPVLSYFALALLEWPIQRRLNEIIEGGLDAWSLRIAQRLDDLKHPQPEVRREAVDDLAELGSHSASLVSALGALLGDDEPEVSKSAMNALSCLVQNAKDTLVAYKEIRPLAE